MKLYRSYEVPDDGCEWVKWSEVEERIKELEAEVAELRSRYLGIDKTCELVDDMRKQTAQEIVQYIIDQGTIDTGAWLELRDGNCYYITDVDITELKGRYGL